MSVPCKICGHPNDSSKVAYCPQCGWFIRFQFDEDTINWAKKKFKETREQKQQIRWINELLKSISIVSSNMQTGSPKLLDVPGKVTRDSQIQDSLNSRQFINEWKKLFKEIVLEEYKLLYSSKENYRANKWEESFNTLKCIEEKYLNLEDQVKKIFINIDNLNERIVGIEYQISQLIDSDSRISQTYNNSLNSETIKNYQDEWIQLINTKLNEKKNQIDSDIKQLFQDYKDLIKNDSDWINKTREMIPDIWTKLENIPYSQPPLSPQENVKLDDKFSEEPDDFSKSPENEKINDDTIKKNELNELEKTIVSQYNKNCNSYAKISTDVSETLESQSNRRLGESRIQFEKNVRGNYWIIEEQNQFYLVPSQRFKINEYNSTTLDAIFSRLNNRSEIGDFLLCKPARVSMFNDERWQLDEPGVIDFK